MRFGVVELHSKILRRAKSTILFQTDLCIKEGRELNMSINIDELTIQEKIGQMMIVGIDKNYITERTKRLILDYKIGGVILYRKNFNSYEELINIIKELKKLNSVNKIPLFISIDQEGGRVNRLPKEFI